MSVESPEFNSFTNDHMLREWDALAAMHAGQRCDNGVKQRDPEVRAIAWEQSTTAETGCLRGLIRILSSAFTNRIDLTHANNVVPRSAANSGLVSLEADRT